MIQWTKILHQIFGYFWLNVWKDSWLILFICNSFLTIIGKVLQSYITSINSQIACKNRLIDQLLTPLKILVLSQYEQAGVLLSSFVILNYSLKTFSGHTDKKNYTPLDDKRIPLVICNKVANASIVLYRDIDFIYTEGKIQFNKTLELYGFEKAVYTVNGVIYSCYLLWGYYRYNHILLDKFTSVLDIPKDWSLKYPQAVITLWDIRYNGCSTYNLKKLFLSITKCATSIEDLTVLKIQDNIVYTKNHTYSGNFNLVTLRQFIPEGSTVFSTSSDSTDIVLIYTSKDTLPANRFPTLPIITDVGVLQAINQNAQAVTNNVLPLTGSNIMKYRLLCIRRNSDTKIPFCQLPATINTAQYIFSNVWKHHAIAISLPEYNVLDILIALNVVERFIPKGTILIVYLKSDISAKLLYPNIDEYNLNIDYYNNSINNGYINQYSQDSMAEKGTNG